MGNLSDRDGASDLGKKLVRRLLDGEGDEKLLVALAQYDGEQGFARCILLGHSIKPARTRRSNLPLSLSSQA